MSVHPGPSVGVCVTNAMHPDPSASQNSPSWDALLPTLQAMYEQLAELTGRLDEVHAGRLHCGKRCFSCCVDDITVFEIEAENIRRNHSGLLQSEAPHATGACAFLDEAGACRIYDSRPYVCRTQGYPLRWLDENADGTIVELRDVCPQNDTAGPIEDIPVEDCWTIGPFEEFLAQLQATADNDLLKRVSLRSLFAAQP